MSILKISISNDGGSLEPSNALRLRHDVESHVGELVDEEAETPGAKGLGMDMATFAVAILSSQAVTALIGVLKSWMERDDRGELTLEGPGGKLSVKASDKHLTGVDLAGLIDQVLTPKPTQE